MRDQENAMPKQKAMLIDIKKHVGLSLSGATPSADQAGAVRQEVPSVLRAREGWKSTCMH
jgi:hypothetical protein